MTVQLFYSPGSCARVTAIALEEADVDFEICLLRMARGEHKQPGYLAVNPKGKVPALVIDGRVLTENVAILSYLNTRHPDAALLPAAADELERSNQIADLCFCAATLHPIVTRICIPRFFAETEDAHKQVHDMAVTMMHGQFQIVEERLDGRPFWYGQDWSVMDGYLYWVWCRVLSGGFPVDAYPRFAAHARSVEARPSVVRALERERLAIDQLRSEGIAVMAAPPFAP
jgi:glutathione S-transferase